MKADELLKKLKTLTMEDIKKAEEEDEQFKALKFLYKHVKGSLFLQLVVANALVSYQLSAKGEKYWWEFAKHFAKKKPSNAVDGIKEFLKACKSNKRLREVKLKRLEKARGAIESISKGTTFMELWKALGGIFGEKKKTVAFAVKMFGYAKRIETGRFEQFPMTIPIPVDSRIKKLTEAITEEDPLTFWQRIAESIGIPPLHLDAVLWKDASKLIDEG